MCTNLGGGGGGGGRTIFATENSPFQADTLRAIKENGAKIQTLREEKAYRQEELDTLMQIPKGRRPYYEQTVIENNINRIKSIDAEIAELEEKNRQIQKAGREENRGQLMFFR